MIRGIFLLIAFFMISVNTCSAALNTTDFAINGINILTAKYDDIVAKWGEPKRKTVDEEGSPAFTYLLYNNMYIQTYNDSGKIAYVKVEDRNYKTARGIAIGSTPYKVVKEYGEPQKQNLNGHIYYVYNLEDTSTYRLLFDMTDGYASRILFTNLKDKP